MGGFTRLSRSLTLRLALFLAIFAAVPVILYGRFQEADEERAHLLLQVVQQQGVVVSKALEPLLQRFDGQNAGLLQDTLTALGQSGLRVRLLLRPRGTEGTENFYYVASSQALAPEQLEGELRAFIETDLLNTLRDTCEGGQPLALRYRNPAGEEEFLTSILPLQAPAGCWAVISAAPASDLLGTAIGRPYWQSPEVQVAALVYIVMALLALGLLLGIWRSLGRFARQARRIARGEGIDGGFAAQNRIPELSRAAQAFDEMVQRLRRTAEAIRHAAEENAHALKAPIATIAQAVEPLRRDQAALSDRSARSLEVIDQSITRLDALISAARRMDETVAELLDPPRERVALSALVEQMLEPYAADTAESGVMIRRQIQPGLHVRASDDLVETVVENIVENALSFTPRGGAIDVELVAREGKAVLSIVDDGPGVRHGSVERIFERYYSHRPAPDSGAAGAADGRLANFGIGLWLVRRNVEAVGGVVEAENAPSRGLRMVVTLPLIR